MRRAQASVSAQAAAAAAAPASVRATLTPRARSGGARALVAFALRTRGAPRTAPHAY
jgi:hypothetical protein